MHEQNQDFAGSHDVGDAAFAGAETAYDPALGADGTGSVEGSQGLSEDEIAAAAASLRQRIEASQNAVRAYGMVAWYALNAASLIQYGVYNPQALAGSVGSIYAYAQDAADALLPLGDVLEAPGSLPAREILERDLAETRATAHHHLLALSAAAASHAHLLEVAPDNVPALLAIGRSLAEAAAGSNEALIGMGVTLAALSPSQPGRL